MPRDYYSEKHLRPSACNYSPLPQGGEVSIVSPRVASPPLYPDSWPHPGATRANNGDHHGDKLPSKTTGRKRNKTMDNQDDVLTRRLAYFCEAGEEEQRVEETARVFSSRRCFRFCSLTN